MFKSLMSFLWPMRKANLLMLIFILPNPFVIFSSIQIEYLIAIPGQSAYMHEQVTNEIG